MDADSSHGSTDALAARLPNIGLSVRDALAADRAIQGAIGNRFDAGAVGSLIDDQARRFGVTSEQLGAALSLANVVRAAAVAVGYPRGSRAFRSTPPTPRRGYRRVPRWRPRTRRGPRPPRGPPLVRAGGPGEGTPGDDD